jgi:hypothetical protein
MSARRCHTSHELVRTYFSLTLHGASNRAAVGNCCTTQVIRGECTISARGSDRFHTRIDRDVLVTTRGRLKAG